MSKRPLRIGFAGTPDLAAVILSRLIREPGISVDLVWAQPDRRKGRGRKFIIGPVKALAIENGIPCEQAENSAELDPNETLAKLDVLVVAAYGMLLPEEILNRPKYGSLNIHTSLLPRWRGAAPIQRAIEAGDKETGVSIMQMEAGLDTGPVWLRKSCTIDAEETAGTLHDKLAVLGADAICEVLNQLQEQTLTAEQQNDALANYAKKISKAEAELDWNCSADELQRKVRAFNPTPVCHTTLNEKELRIWKASCGESNQNQEIGKLINQEQNKIEISCREGSLVLEEIQLPGKKPMAVNAFLNGYPDFLTKTNVN